MRHVLCEEVSTYACREIISSKDRERERQRQIFQLSFYRISSREKRGQCELENVVVPVFSRLLSYDEINGLENALRGSAF